MQALKQDVVDFRTSGIEHVVEPGIVGISAPLDSSRLPILTRGSNGMTTGDLERLLSRIDEHVDTKRPDCPRRTSRTAPSEAC